MTQTMENRTTSREWEPPAARAASASAEGSRRFAERFADRFAEDFYRDALAGLSLSSIGLGTYLGDCTDDDDARYVETARLAFDSGVNVVDTALNYRCQRSERAIGAALEHAIERGRIRRDEVLVCTKGGYVPMEGEPLADRARYQDYLRREFFEPGVMRPDDVVAGGHSLAPGFLRWCITRSRRNLGVRTIDLYYLHNPEAQLPAMTPASFRERLRAAFMVLEDAVGRGEIAAYGCATWNALRTAPGGKGHISLTDLATIAREVAGDRHHFRAVQLPISLAMPEAVRTATQQRTDGEVVSALDAARDLGLAVMASAPLMQARLTRDLPPQVRALFPTARTDAQRALSFVRSLPGVTTALVGMKHPAHLTENLESARR